MSPEKIIKELELLAQQSGATVRYEKGDFDGGYCVLREERMIVVNKRLATPRRASLVAQALADIGVDEVYLKPAVRDFIEEELSKAAAQS
jgi:hypothetical protein